ncbi:MAG: ATP-binding protein [Hyphomicrobiales bacterium]|nr:ATP-binding protein [Hyphomicrobiales bacterium]
MRTEICKVTVVGNTCMHHLLLGIDPTPLGSAPYNPVLKAPYQCPARECGLRLHENAQVYLLPIIAGFVGADTVAMILSSKLDGHSGNVIAVDIGTNAEVVLKSDQGLIACSSPAGPALEGGQIRDGMRAAFGAVDRVSADRDIIIHTIGDAPALGICGSGLIDAVAVLLDLGIINKTGRLLAQPNHLLPDAIAARLRHGEDGSPEFVLVRAVDSGNHLDIVLSQGDIRQLQLAKAAIMSGVQALLQQVDLECSDIDSFLLAGGFGNYINIRNARRIGLIPDLANERIHYIANAAGLGAQMALLSDQCRTQAERIAVETKHLSLAGLQGFQKMYLGAMGFPAGIKE